MSNLIYLTLEGNIQGKISAGCGSQASVGNRYQLGHEDEIFVFSLMQEAGGTGAGFTIADYNSVSSWIKALR